MCALRFSQGSEDSGESDEGEEVEEMEPDNKYQEVCTKVILR